MTKKEKALSNRDRKIIKSVSGNVFNCTCWTNSPPNWFVEMKSEGKIRAYCYGEGTMYLRDDGHLFSVSHRDRGTDMPMEQANIVNTKSFWKNIFKSEKVPVHDYMIWEVTEFVPDSECPDLSNLWIVGAGARRSGRHFYTARRKTAKQYLEGPDENIHWIYSERYDQFTEAYEKRYRKRVKETAKERRESAEYSRKHAKTFEFNFNFNDFIAEKPTVDHYAILGISKKAGPREVKQAFWDLARQYHPDLNPNDSKAEETFKCISVSYQELMKQFNG